MRDRYRLGGIGNDQLLAALSSLVRREHDLMSDLLAHLAELDERRLYLELGFTSLFAYCTEALGFCKSSAGRRIAVARTCRKYPEAFVRVARGELLLSVLSLLGPHLNAKNAAELFDACRQQSCEQVELLLAARFPKPDVRDLIRRLPTRLDASTPDTGSQLEAMPLSIAPTTENRPLVAREAATQPDSEEAEATVETAAARDAVEARPSSPAIPVQSRLEPLSAARFGVHFTADTEFRELLEEVRALASHRESSQGLLSVMKRGLEAYRRELQKQRFGVGRNPRRVRSGRARAEANDGAANDGAANDGAANDGAANDGAANDGAANERRSRRVPAAVAREVYLRDGGACSFCSENGRRCGARRFLELDHVTPWAAGGDSTIENLRLRCRAHNQHAARRYFGAELVRVAAAARGTREGPRAG